MCIVLFLDKYYGTSQILQLCWRQEGSLKTMSRVLKTVSVQVGFHVKLRFRCRFKNRSVLFRVKTMLLLLIILHFVLLVLQNDSCFLHSSFVFYRQSWIGEKILCL